MTESDRQFLREYSKEYISIGITADGKARRSVRVPWFYDSNAYNMCIPDLYFSPEELADGELWVELQRFTILGCYIFCPLADYSFLSRLPRLRDITIFQGENLKTLEFLRATPDWLQLHIEDAALENLDPLFSEGPRRGFFSRCVCLAGCTVADHSALVRPEIYLSELVILMPQGSNEKDRWKNVRCGKYTYREYKLPED